MNTPLHIAADHPALAGHFPGNPIVPGVVLLDETLFAIGSMMNEDLTKCVIKNVKFLSPVTPGQAIDVEYSVSTERQIRFTLSSGSQKVSTGVISLSESA